jgi:uncharacterized membrane protein YheB (UPF0754 family)
MNLNTAEKFLILAHHPEKGRFVVRGTQLSYGLVGALLLEMSLENIVSVQDNRLVYRSAGTGNDEVISELSAIIRQSEKARKIRTWINRFARKSRRYRWVILRQLADKRLIRIENKKFLGLIPYKSSYITNNGIRAELIRTARNNVLFHKDLTDENVVVLGLIEACRMHRILSTDREELKRIRKDLKEIIKASPIAGVVAETIKQVQAAVIAAVVASSAASSGGH